MKVNSGLARKLQLISPDDDVNWNARYTGSDHPLVLPDALTDDAAREFLLAFARFEDRAAALNNCGYRERPANQLYDYLKKTEESGTSNSLPGIITRAWFNTHVLRDRRGFPLQYLTDYVFDQGDAFKAKIAARFDGYGGGRIQRKMHQKKMDAEKAPYFKQETESWEGYVQRFLGYCGDNAALSPRGFMEAMACNVKPQYTEPWLLYMGQSIRELRDTCEFLNAPENHRQYIARLEQAFQDSGLAAAVETMRGFALSTEARHGKRIAFQPDKAGGNWMDRNPVARFER